MAFGWIHVVFGLVVLKEEGMGQREGEGHNDSGYVRVWEGVVYKGLWGVPTDCGPITQPIVHDALCVQELAQKPADEHPGRDV